MQLIEATNDTTILVRAAEAGARQIWRDGYRYSKAGVVTVELVAMDRAPRALFGGFDRERGKAHDRHGRGQRPLRTRRGHAGGCRHQEAVGDAIEKRSPRYTMRLSDLPNL